MPDMSQETKLQFNGTWRTYQKRILDNLNFHLRDSKLHVVAAPGAGKTTLGIEVIARLNRPALILCPTNTIKNQWRERICSSFLRKEDHGIVSTAIRKPGYITVITYQALLAAFCGEEEVQQDSPTEEDEPQAKPYSITASGRFKPEKAEEVIGILRQAGISLLCFDEAHHLRKEWWKALTYLNEHLNPEQTLALTATPPYDADYSEWKRYQELCGEIDEVISIPELVKNGDLCPHQDFIFYCPLSKFEQELLDNHRQNANILLEKLRNDTQLLDQLSGLRFLQADDADLEVILDSPEFFVSIASFLHECGRTVPDKFLQLFDAKAKELPAFDAQWAATFLSGFFGTEGEAWEALAVKRDEYCSQAKKMRLTDGKRIVLDGNDKFSKQIANSTGKLDAIVKIATLESGQLEERLRMVILADFIRMNDTDCSTLGVVPIWRKLKDACKGRISLGVLCGTLILLPQNALGKLQERIAANGIATDAISTGRFDKDEDYVRILPKEGIRNHIVRLVTEMFNAGDLTVLVGTQALLGEGWDAPSINSLVLSSTVSSYMLSNQMRGRAIRVDKDHPDKVSNIWHLASYYPKDWRHSPDLRQLATRFEGFEAPAYLGNHEIVSGLARVMDAVTFVSNSAPTPNLDLACNRELTRKWWKDALYVGYSNKQILGLTTGVQAPGLTVSSLQYAPYAFFVCAILSAALSLIYFPPSIARFGWIATGVLLLIVFVKFCRTGTIGRVMKQVAIVILETLSAQGLIKTSLKQVDLKVTTGQQNAMIDVYCANLPAAENNLFIQALQEFLDPVENPRYLLVRRARFMKVIQQKDYFAIPSVIATNKQNVEIFQGLWHRYIGRADILYTRSAEGRKALLKARRSAFSAINKKWSKRISKWQ